jgi:mitochondrial fission protein ELM1
MTTRPISASSAPSALAALTAWVITDGKSGIVNQAVGLAEAIGIPFVEKTVSLAAPWRWLPANFWPQGTLGTANPTRAQDALTPPWPNLVISCGRQAVGPARAVKAKSGAFHAHIQHPRMLLSTFDVLIVPAHDRLDGENVIVTKGAIHRVTPARLATAAAEFKDLLAPLPRPLIAVLIGGGSKSHRLTPERCKTIAAQLQNFAKSTGGGLAITTSRRTGAQNEAILRDALGGPDVFFWNGTVDGAGENPYFGLLGLADHIVVTADSVNMVSEACRTGKPVHVIDLDGGSAKFTAFHKSFRDAGFTRIFSGEAAEWTYEPLDETGRAAAEILDRLKRAALT